jgi:hypothetical protein
VVHFTQPSLLSDHFPSKVKKGDFFAGFEPKKQLALEDTQ